MNRWTFQLNQLWNGVHPYFQADTYVGIMQSSNEKLVLSNKCIQNDHTLVFIDYINKYKNSIYNAKIEFNISSSYQKYIVIKFLEI